MTYTPIEYHENKKRYAIVSPSPDGQLKSIVVQIEHLSETLDEFKELNNRIFKVKIVDRTDEWVKQFPEV